MALPISQLMATTIKNYIPTLKSNLPMASSLLAKLKDRGNLKLDGGETVIVPLEYAFNGTTQAFDGADVLNVAENDIITAAEYQWKAYNTAITIKDTDLAKNKGAKGIIKLLESKLKNGERSMFNKLSQDLFSDGTGANGKEMLGLKALISTTPAVGTVAGIDASTNEFWRNIAVSGVAWGASGAGRNQLESTQTEIKENGGKCDLIILGKTAYNALRKEFAVNERYTNIGGTKPSFGIAEFNINGADVYFDPFCPADYAYLISTEFLQLYINSNMNFSTTQPQSPVDQAIKVSHIRVMLNLGVSNRSAHAVISGITAA